jgi:hypothetical protein
MASYNTGSSIVYNTKKQKDQLWSFVASNEKCKGSFQVTDIEAALIHAIEQGVV